MTKLYRKGCKKFPLGIDLRFIPVFDKRLVITPMKREAIKSTMVKQKAFMKVSKMQQEYGVTNR